MSLYDRGVGYSAINTARCALSTFIVLGNHTAGAHPLVVRFVKGVYNLRPPRSRYTEIWDVSIVLQLLKALAPAKYLSLKDLTLKLVTLMALVSAQRAQTLHLLTVRDMVVRKNSVTFPLHSVLKQSRPGKSLPVVEFKAYVPDRRLCVVNYIKEYLKRMEKFHERYEQFYLSYGKNRRPVSKATVARWIKTMLFRAGIKSCYTAHSTRAASVSVAHQLSVPIDEILLKAGWSSADTFAQYYKKPIHKAKDFASAVLGSA